MSHCHNHHCHDHGSPNTPQFRKVLWLAFVLNFTMCLVEIGFGFQQGSVALKADAVDFLGDALTYLITLLFLHETLAVRAKVGMAKGVSLLLFGVFVLVESGRHIAFGIEPNPPVMGAIGFLALAVNVFCAAILYFYREGDSNVRSVWLCSRNDAIGNVAIIVAAGFVYLLGSNWPDVLVGLLIGVLGVHSGYSICRQAWHELHPKSKEENDYV